MKIVILTNNRKPNYIYRCIRDIRRDYKGVIDLMISGDPTYLKKYTKGFRKHYVEQDGLDKPWKKACKGYSQCLALGKKDGVLIIEDDTGFKKGWYKQFLQYISFVKDKRYIISLGKAMDGSVINPNMKVPSLQLFLYRVNLKKESDGNMTSFIITWLDSHAVYYPPTMPYDDLVAYFDKFGVKSSSMHDILIGYYLFRKLYPIWIASPPVAINIGAHTSSVGVITDMNQDYLDWDYTGV